MINKNNINVNDPDFNEQEARAQAGYRELDAMENAKEIRSITDMHSGRPEHKIIEFLLADGTGAEWDTVQNKWVG